ncbi:MAG: IS3 family transposase [Acidimicrobiia bacterium]|nr:IS3 family transposase [Acidimicrobiia bacterium]
MTSSESSPSAGLCRWLRARTTRPSAARPSPSARALRDAVMMQVLMALWVTNRKVYGAHKLWKAARRAGHDIGRDQVARLMRQMGIQGVSRRRKVFTTRPDPDAVRAPDLVERDFTAERPDALWVTDLTYVPTRSGMAYVCFIVDAFSRRIVGWRVASNMKTEMVLDALGDGPPLARRPPARRAGHPLRRRVAVHAVRFTERLDEIGARPSIGTVADSYDNALAETTNGLYKTECVYGPDSTRLGRRRPARARDAVVGPLVQRAAPPRPLRRRPTSRVRSSVLRCPTGRPRRGWNPIARVSIRPRAVHCIACTCCLDGALRGIARGPFGWVLPQAGTLRQTAFRSRPGGARGASVPVWSRVLDFGGVEPARARLARPSARVIGRAPGRAHCDRIRVKQP